ncbi:ubiquitin-protein transferase activating protein [Pichia kluyveri]|uniref:Ubiquitin-protein transferase activating protein n=1 Tax=Pichia kluyveri TaxID=36015 RepID=A0AAV5QYP7_PICKL|nr:ubiquitin-protein transferase activating protein [Pichia kluyveri]
MTSPIRKTPSATTPKYHRTIFGNTSPNLVNQSTNSLYSNTKGILSPNFNIVNSDWNNSYGSKFKPNSKKVTGSVIGSAPSSSSSLRRSSFNKRRTFGDIFNENNNNSLFEDSGNKKKIKTNDNNNNNNNNSGKSHNDLNDIINTPKSKLNNTNTPITSTRKLRRTNTNELLDRFIPNRQSTSGKLSIEKTKSLPSFALPSDHIDSITSEIYQNSVAEACGLEVGSRILQFQLPPPESNNNSNNNNNCTTNNTTGTSLRRVTSYNSSLKTRQMISTNAAQARMKKVPLCPEKVLDAPGLIDDFYLNLISWSNENLLAIALNKSVYCWNANDGKVKLITECEFIITSIKWSPDDYYLSIGLDNGSIEIWDIETVTKLRTMKFNLNNRISSQSWNEHFLTIGLRNGEIFNNDVRISNHLTNKFENHLGEICGLEWRNDGIQLASGGNDNIVNIWDYRKSKPIFTKTAHNAAVKAISWCPTQTNLLATGGGSSCKMIHFWNSNTGCRINSIETESQVSSLQWGYSNGIGKEIVATHGYPNNEIGIYSYPSLQKTGVIIDAHESRILNSQLSPNGTILATIASDENLKFWKIFDEMPVVKKDAFTTSSSGKDMGKVMTIR